MTALSLLAVVADSPDDDTVVAVAADFAVRLHSHVRVVSFLSTPVGAVSPALVGGAPTPLIWREFDERQMAVEARIEALVRRYADRLGLSSCADGGGSLVHVPVKETGRSTLMAELPLVDVVVMGQSSVTQGDPWTGPLDEVLMAARTPVLVARDSEPVAGRPAAIAWDGSLEAGRAIRAAVPFLRDASWVALLQAPAKLDTCPSAGADPGRVTEYLARCGITVKDVIKVGGSRIGPALLAAAKGADAGLLVAGAYRHSRLREAVFGGATRSFLTDANGPHLLIVH